MRIYKITNTVNGKIYIGCTIKTIKERLYAHFRQRKGKQTGIRAAFCKYGRESFIIEEIEEVDSVEEMYEREIYWISHYKSKDRRIGYNMTSGGDCGPIMTGENHPMFGKKNNRIAEFNRTRKREPVSEETRKKISQAGMNRVHRKDSIDKMSIARKKKWDEGGYENVGNIISMAKKGIRSIKIIPILCLNNYKVYDGAMDAAKKLNLSQGNVHNVVNGKYKHTKGYVFEKLIAEHLIF